MTDLEKWLEESRGREQEITKDPWKRGIGNDCEKVFSTQKDIVAVCGPRNGTFIAHARTDLPKALRMLEVAVDGLLNYMELENIREVLTKINQIAKEK